MEWVEVTGKTVEAAKEAALDQLGVDEDDAEFEILEQPKPGLFGRLRAEARVRARVMPSVPRPKVERRDRKRPRRRPGEGEAPSAGGGASAGASASAGESGNGGAARGARGGARSGAGGVASAGSSRAASGGRRSQGQGEQHDHEGEHTVSDQRDDEHEGDEDGIEVAESFLDGLLEVFGAPYTIVQRPLEEDLVELSVQGDGLGLLIGARGQTLSAVQELTRTVVQRRSRDRSGRIIIDIAGYRQARRAALERFAGEVAAQVISSGSPRVLEPMPPADRKVVHDAINAIDGVSTSSEGEEPRRRVVISPQGATA